MCLTIDRSHKVACFILAPHRSVSEKESVSHLLLAALEMPKRGKGKGSHASKVPKVTTGRATRSASNDGTHPQWSGRREGEDSPSSSVISREDVALVIDEVLKSLRQHDIAPSRPNRAGGPPSAEATGKTEAKFSRSQDVEDLHLPG